MTADVAPAEACEVLDALDALEALIERRRTSLLVDPERAVDPGLIDRLCALAMWAPNHKRTWPWRFAVFTGDARGRLGEAFAEDQIAVGVTDHATLTKTREKYRRAPVVVVVGAEPGESDERTGENRDAVSAGIQNMLLGATAAGLASFWSSPPVRHGRHALAACSFAQDTTIVGVLYFGWPAGAVPVPPRPSPPIRRLS